MRFGRYEILEPLGEGGMGSVSLACERGAAGATDRLIALKVVLPEHAEDKKFIAYLEREAHIIASLSHPNIVGIHRLGEHEGRYFIAMEHVQGASLHELLAEARRRRVKIPLGAAMAAIIQASRGAHAAHELCDEHGAPLGLVHRDITPSNIMVDERGVVKLLDFGIAIPSARSTAGVGVAGKTPYLSPEQAHMQPLDRRSDVFALGTTLWELIAGRRRYDASDLRACLFQIAAGVAPPIRDAVPDVPEGVARILDVALAFRREDRFDTAEELARTLEETGAVLGVDAGSELLAETMATFVGSRMAARMRKVLDIEKTLHAPAAAMPGGVDDHTLVDTSGQLMGATAPDSATAETEPQPPIGVVPVDLDVPVYAAGPNWELRTDAIVATCRVWARPDLSRDEGARAAQNLMARLDTLFAQTPTLRAFLLDVRAARMVIGGKTLGVLEHIFESAESRGVAVAALIAADPIQRLDFRDLVGRVAPRKARVFQDAGAATRYLLSSTRAAPD